MTRWKMRQKQRSIKTPQNFWKPSKSKYEEHKFTGEIGYRKIWSGGTYVSPSIVERVAREISDQNS